MVFSSIKFIGVFFPILMMIYAVAKEQWKKVVLLVGSLVFYGVGEPYYILLLLASLVINYYLGKIMIEDKINKKICFSIILVWNLGNLLFFKYFDFFTGNVNAMADKNILPVLNLALPLGISFYTFQIISYQIDVYRGTQKEKANLLDFSLYVCMFPQLVAGPIVQYHEVEKYIKRPAFCWHNLDYGLKVFTIGLGLKVLLANQISTLFHSVQGIGAYNLNVSIAWLGAIAYTFQIYFDFWGYSLMAIGLGQMLGYRLPENFNHPYISKSITEFWRRWHITLSRWFREYVYIPLGGNRKGKVRTFINLFVVWSLTGFWHGANWNFVIWGLFFFVILVIEKQGLADFLERHKVVGHLYCALIIPISWMIFANTDLTMMISYIKAMVGANVGHELVGITHLLGYVKDYFILLIACIVCITPYPMKAFEKFHNKKITSIILFAIFWYSIYEIYIGKNNPFLYFKF